MGRSGLSQDSNGSGSSTSGRWTPKYSPAPLYTAPPTVSGGGSGAGKLKGYTPPPFSNVGKYDISPLSFYSTEFDSPGMGAQNAAMGGLPDMIGQWAAGIAPEPLKGIANWGGQAVGNVLGFTGNVFGELPNPFGLGAASIMSKALKESHPDLWARFQTEQPQNPEDNTMEYSDKWLKWAANETDFGPTLFRDLLVPRSTLGGGVEQLMQATLSIPSRLEQKLIIGRDATYDRIMQAKEGDGVAYELQQRAKAEGMSRDDVMDEAIVQGVGMSNDLLTSTVLTMAIDPALWATLGAGALEKIGVTSANALGRGFGTAMKTAGKVDEYVGLGQKALEAGYASTRGIPQYGDIFRYAEETGQYTAQVKAAMEASPYAARFYMTPKLAAAARKVSHVLDPFTLMGGEGKALGADAWKGATATLGATDTFKPFSVWEVQSGVGRLLNDSNKAFTDDFGRAVSNSATMVGNRLANQRQARLMNLVDVSNTIMGRAKGAVGALSKDSLRRLMAEEIDRVKTVATVEETVAYLVRKGANHDEALKWANTLSDDARAVIHYMNFGHSIDRFLAAQKGAVGRFASIVAKSKGGKKYADPATMSFAREDTLTLTEAAGVINEVGAGNLAAAREAAVKYSVLNRVIDMTDSDEKIANQVVRMLKAMRTDGHLPLAVDTSKTIVDDALLDFVRDYAPYRLIYKPKNLAHVVMEDDGKTMKDLSTWIDWVDESAAVFTSDRVTAAVKNALRPVFFSTIKNDAARRFEVIMVNEHGLTRGESTRAFNAILKQAETQKTTVRALYPSEVAEAVSRVGFKVAGWDRRFSERQITDAMLRSWEGSMSVVGFTQKLTGRAKTLVAKPGGNWLGVLAERYYPMARYRLNPYYQLQEMFETPINMMASGFNVLFRRNQIDEDVERLMEMLKSTAYAGDQDIANQLYLLQMDAANQVVNGKTRLGSRTDAVKRFFKPTEYKRYAEYRRFVRRFGKDFGSDMWQESPETYLRMVATYADSAGGENEMVVMWMHDLIAQRNPDKMFATHMPSAVRPTIFAKRAPVSQPLVAYLHGNKSWEEMVARLTDTGDTRVTETSLREALRVHGADPDYVERAVALATGTPEDEWYAGFRAAGTPEREIRQFQTFMEVLSRQQGIPTRELVALTQAGKPVLYDELTKKYRGNPTFYQSLVDANEARGLKMLPLDHEFHVEMKRLIDIELEAIARNEGTVAKAKRYATGLRNVRTKGKGRQPAPTQDFFGPGGAGKGDGPVHIGGAQHEDIEVRAEQQMDMLTRVMGREQVRDMALWYDQIRQAILALAGNDPNLGAKMLLRFSYSQLNTSPELGMRLILRLTEDLHTGKIDLAALPAAFDKLAAREYKSLYGLNAVRQLQSGVEPWELATSEGLAQKLMDFTDSVAGNRLRMVDGYRTIEEGGTGLGPVAGDVHMRRVLGFYDQKSTVYLRHLTGDNTLKLVDGVGYQGADGKVIIDWAHITKSTQPTNDEYAYILDEVNNLAKEFTRAENGAGFMGLGEWTPAMVQAVLWHRIRSASGDFEGTPLAAVYNNMWHVGTDYKPGLGAPSHLYPWDSLTDRERGLMADVTGRVVADTAADAAGTRVMSMRVVRGGLRGAKGEVVTNPVHVSDVFTSQQGVQNHIDAAAIAGGQDEVRAMRTTKTINRARYQAPVPEGAKKPNPPTLSTRVRVGEDPKTGKDIYEDLLGRQHFATDLVLDATELADVNAAIKVLEQHGDQWLGDGFVTIQNAEGNFVIRFVDQRSKTWNQHTKAITDEQLDGLSEVLRSAGYENRADRTVAHIITSKQRAAAKSEEYGNYGQGIIDAARGRGDSAFADRLERALPTARERLETAIGKVAGRKVTAHRAGLGADDPGLDWSRTASPALRDEPARPTYYQRTNGTIRGATVVADDGRRLIGINPKLARGDTRLHEVWHSLEPLLQPSGRASIIRAYNRVKGLPVEQGIEDASIALTGEKAEWFVNQMVYYFKRGEVGEGGDLALVPVFEYYRKVLKDIRDGSGVMAPAKGGALSDIGEAMFAKHPEANAVNYDLEQDALQALAHERIQQATRFGERWTYFRPGRSALERSLNHPYLGLYPLSYFYGQVLPQLLEFLVARPFGLKAPFAGYIATNYIYRSVMLQQTYDEEFRQWMADNEPGFRALATITPGLPWEVPVNLAPTYRRVLQAELENVQRGEQGLEPKNIDWGKIGSDIASRAFNPVTQIEQTVDIGQGLVQGATGMAAQAAGAAFPEAPQYSTAEQSFLVNNNDTEQPAAPQNYPGYTRLPSLDESLQGDQSLNIVEQAAADLESMLSDGVYPQE